MPDVDKEPSKEPKLATAVYFRVSTSGQEGDTSAEAQEAACVEWVESRGGRVDKVHVYRDVGSEGGADA